MKKRNLSVRDGTEGRASKADCVLQECFAPYGIGLATQRSSPLKTKFDPLLLRMVESGLVQHWFTESLRKSKNVSTSPRVLPEGDIVTSIEKGYAS